MTDEKWQQATATKYPQVSKCNDWKLQTSKHTCTQDPFPVPLPVHPVLQIEVISGSCAIQVSEETLPHPQAAETAGPLSGQAWGCTKSGHYQSPWPLPVSNAQNLDTTSLQQSPSKCMHRQLGHLGPYLFK